MTTPDTFRSLDLLDTGADNGGCGCGGCGCGSTSTETENQESQKTVDTAQSFAVTGMTCGHCAGAVTSELKALDGVTDVRVDLVAGGTSTVSVTSKTPLKESQVAAALDAAGAYRLS